MVCIKNPYQQQTKKNREAIVIEYAHVVKHIARRLVARLPSEFDIDDLIQAGMIGLMESADKFDPTKENKFQTYAELRIRGAMLDYLRFRDWVPRSVKDNSNKLEKAYSALRAANCDHPTDKQLAKQLGLKLSELNTFLDKSRPIPLLSIEALGAASHDGENLDILETISDPKEEDPVSSLLGKEAKEVVIKAVQKLPEKEQLVLSLYYNEELNLKEIAAVLEISESRVCQIRTKAIGMLRSIVKEYITI